MGVLFIFILISILVISALLFFNKGEKAQEIKSTLKNIYENLKELFSNLKKLFLIIKELIQSKLDQEPTQLKDDSTANNSPKGASSSESKTTSPAELDPQSDDSINLSTESQSPASDEPETTSPTELDPQSEDSINLKKQDT